MKFLVVALAFLLCWTPANVLVRWILKKNRIKVPTAQESSHGGADSFKAGALIGVLERWLILLLVLLRQYEIIGWMIAGKSIIRFREAVQTEKSEYVLAGTLLSFLVALLCGVAVNLVIGL